jgi:hypothetical protein
MKLLCLDGGGVFGVGQALVLSGLDNSKWDAVCGTSIGAFAAGLIATGQPISVGFFRDHAKDIFRKSLSRQPVWGARHDDSAFNKVLGSYFGEKTLREANIPTFIVASSVSGHSPKVFSSLNMEDGSMLFGDVIRASCAAPTYFRPWQGYTDGGVFANNPAMIGVSWLMRERGVRLEDIEVCSIGTGMYSRSGHSEDGGIFHWFDWLIKALLEDGSARLVDEIVSSLPLKRYLRYQFLKRNGWKINSVPDMEAAIAAWTKPAMEMTLKIKHGILSYHDGDGNLVKLDKNEEALFEE